MAAPKLAKGDEIRIRGEGGAFFGVVVPDPESHLGETFAARLKRGEITVVDDNGEELSPQPTLTIPGQDDVADSPVPTKSVKAVVDWVDGDVDRGVRALEVEFERGDDVRSGVVTKVVAAIGKTLADDPERAADLLETLGDKAGDTRWDPLEETLEQILKLR